MISQLEYVEYIARGDEIQQETEPIRMDIEREEPVYAPVDEAEELVDVEYTPPTDNEACFSSSNLEIIHFYPHFCLFVAIPVTVVTD